MQGNIRYIVIAIVAGVLFLPLLGHVHLFDWDEINFAECAREMIVSKDYLRVQIDYMPFWEKPPLFIWMQVLSMKLFGINEYAARFPNAVIGVATLLTIYYAGKRIVNQKMATWWVLLYAATWLPHFYFKSGIIDPSFNFFIFIAFFQFHLIKYGEKKMLHAVLSGLFLGLAVLTKGPVALLVSALSLMVYLVVNRGFKGYAIKHFLIILLFAVLVTVSWFGIEILNDGVGLVKDFIAYQIRLFRTEDADHGGPFFYHFIILLFGCFPASVFLFQYSKKRVTDTDQSKDFKKLMWIMFWVVLILFSIVKTKIVHYSSLCYFPLTYLAAVQLYRIGNDQVKLKGIVTSSLLVIGSLLAIIISALPLVGIYKNKLIPLIEDKNAVGNLQANVSWTWMECLWGVLYLIGIWVAVYIMKRNFKRGIITLCVLQLVIIQITVLHFTPKVEAYSQRASIDFFESLKGKDVYVHTLGYKSYAHLFYTEKQPYSSAEYYSKDSEKWLLTGKVDKPTYFVAKLTVYNEYKAMPQLQVIGEKNGFVFFKRK